ncbi:MAG: hypothetical protein ACREER_10360 [Alphaproteobacteria bacterium]
MDARFPDPAPLLEQADRILAEAKARGITLRLLGAIAFHLRCPTYNHIQRATGRVFTDIDFMSYFKQMPAVERLFAELGYDEDRRIKSVPGLRRSIFLHGDRRWHSDVFYDVLDFSHEIDLRGRLELDYPTLSLVDLLLEKMQIARINEKDVIDTLMLLREHDIGEGDDHSIRGDHLARRCKSDWGLWKTVTTNLDVVDRMADKYDVLGPTDRRIIRDRARSLRARIDREPATLKWKLRGRIGERVKWYREVDEVK